MVLCHPKPNKNITKIDLTIEHNSLLYLHQTARSLVHYPAMLSSALRVGYGDCRSLGGSLAERCCRESMACQLGFHLGARGEVSLQEHLAKMHCCQVVRDICN